MVTRKVFVGLIWVFLPGFALGGEAIPNWSAPATWSPARTRGGLTTMGDATPPLPFIGADPCRIADTRGNGFAGAYGPPSFSQGSPRNFTLTGQCGIPPSAKAVSLNVTVTNTQGPGFILIYPAGGTQPTVSTLNYVAGQTIANAAVVPLGGNFGAITVVAGVSGTDLILDMNGYYSDEINSGERFVIGGRFDGGSVIVGVNGSTASGSSAVRGFEVGFGATVYGVRGETLSTTSGTTGVSGSDGALAAGGNQGSFSSAGVEGDGQNGVIGRTSTSGGNGVSGVTQTTAGLTTYGALGTTTHGVWAFVGDIGCTSCTKPFVDPHPTDPTKEIRFVALEGNEAGTYFRGTAETVGREFVIQVPEDFRLVTDAEGMTVQLTPVGAPASMYIVSEDLNQIVVRSSRDVKFHYLVHGVRETFKNIKTIQEMSAFLPQTPDGRMPQGWAETTKQRLIANGTYNPDGTLNSETAERAGWVKMWADREAQARAAAAANAAARGAIPGGK